MFQWSIDLDREINTQPRRSGWSEDAQERGIDQSCDKVQRTGDLAYENNSPQRRHECILLRVAALLSSSLVERAVDREYRGGR
jgi:hypothetical protein